MVTCKACLLELAESEFYKHPKTLTGFNPRCKACIKTKNPIGFKTNRRIPVKGSKTLTVPDGQGGKWWFDLKALKSNPEVLALAKSLGKQNKNVKRLSWNNLMLISYDKSQLDLIALTAKMNPKAVYELPKLDLKTNKPLPSKYGLMLHF